MEKLKNEDVKIRAKTFKLIISLFELNELFRSLRRKINAVYLKEPTFVAEIGLAYYELSASIKAVVYISWTRQLRFQTGSLLSVFWLVLLT